MRGRLKELTMNMDGSQNITVMVTSDARSMFDELKNDDVNIEIKKYRQHRSMNANAYAWVLIDRIAARLSKSVKEVYREAIRDIGGVSEIICVKTDAVPMMKKIWEGKGMGWQTEEMPSKLPGCTDLVLFYGSSVYDTKQMSSLIDHLVQDAQALGIPTITTSELERMMAHYRGTKPLDERDAKKREESEAKRTREDSGKEANKEAGENETDGENETNDIGEAGMNVYEEHFAG